MLKITTAEHHVIGEAGNAEAPAVMRVGITTLMGKLAAKYGCRPAKLAEPAEV